MTPSQFVHSSRALGFPLRRAALLLGLATAMAACDALAIVMMLPTLQFIQANGDVSRLAADSRVWQFLASFYGLFGTTPGLAVLLATSFVFVVLRQALNYIYSIAMAKTKTGLIRGIRLKLFDAFMRVSLGEQEKTSAGGLISSFTAQTDGAAIALIQFVHVVSMIVLFNIYGFLLLLVSWQMTIASLVLILAVAFAMRGVMMKSLGAGSSYAEANENFGAFLGERLRSLRLVRLSGMEQAENAALQRLTAAQRAHMIELERLGARVGFTMEPVIIGIAFVFLYGGYTYLQLGLEQLGLFLLVLLRLMPIGKDMMKSRQLVIAFTPMLGTIEDRLNRFREAREVNTGAKPFVGIREAISLRNVAFAYGDGAVPALRGVDLDIPARSFVALVGPSGSGKSTLVDLLPRLRIPQSGTIAIDGQAIETFDLVSLRAGISYAPQSPQIFNVTVAEHVRYGRPEASEADIWEALDHAGAKAFVANLVDGLDTPLGEGGVSLSGGQRQRLDLARVLVRRAPLIILDEPVSALDADAESAFRESLEHIRKTLKPTIVLVAHRLSTVMLADHVVVLEHGRVIEAGPPARLAHAGGWFARALARQSIELIPAEPAA